MHIAVGMFWILLLPALLPTLMILLPSPQIEPAEVPVKSVTLTLTLPALGERASGSGRPAAAGRKARGAASDSRPASDKTGFTFLGPQPIVSMPAHPDNLIQTVRQPDIPNPPKLKMPIAAPNILQVASPAVPVLAPQPKLLDTASHVRPGERIPIRTTPSETVTHPKLSLPVSGEPASRSLSALMTSNSAAPKLAEVSPPPPPVSGEGSDRHNLLVVNAMPAAPTPPQMPAGELAGAFSVSPDGNPGTSAGTPTTSSPGAGLKGSSTGPASGRAMGNGPGSGSSSAGNAGGGGSNIGAGPGNGSGHAGLGGTSGVGTGSDSGPAGRGSGNTGVPGGSGGTGNSSFPGVSIGSATPAINAAGAPPKVAMPRGTYGMTIVASSASGGGVGDFGIFKNEIVYTVYLDVAEPDHARPKWTLQYASTIPGANANVVAPFPITKEYPRLPQQVLSRNIGRKLVVTGLITKEGKVDSLRVIQSPNPLLIQPVLDCLTKWSFQAAETNGEQVAVKFVLGIPITAELLSGN